MTRSLVRNRALWLGFFAVFVPLGLLFALQYRWLAHLERTSAIAQKAWLSNYLEAVSNGVEYFYRAQAERALNVPESLLATPNPETIGSYFRKKEVEGARYLFAYKSWPERSEALLVVFDPATGATGLPDDPRTSRAIQVALAPWKATLHKGGVLESHALSVDERDPDNRIIMNPLSDDGCAIVGVAGMVVDDRFFESSVLPRAIDMALPKFFDRRAQENLVVTVRDGRGRVILGQAGEPAGTVEVSRPLAFLFSDWKLMLGSRHTTAEEWAQSNFVLNMSLSALLAVVLLGGVVLALRTASRELRLSQMKSDFVSNVSHELRTPIASIRVFGEFLRLGRVRQDEKIREYGEYIETESRRLTQLIDNILDFSKIESGAKTYEFETLDLREALADTLRSLAVRLRHQGFRLVVESPDTPLPGVHADRDAIAQALANLVDNAAKYSGQSTEVFVRIDEADGEVVLSVRDRGIGISRDEQDKIFERFHRVSTGLVHDVRGSGLGLAIVRHIAQAHGGRVRVESAPGSGSTFFVHLPAATAAPAGATMPAPVDVARGAESA